MKICAYDGCLRKHHARGLCQSHYDFAMKDMWLDLPPVYDSQRTPRLCSIEGCDNPHKAKGMCKFHHSRWLAGDRGERLTRPKGEYEKSNRLCDIDGCDNKHYSKGRGKVLHRRWRDGARGEWLTRPKGKRKDAGRVCSIDGCDRPHNAKGLCRVHRARLLAGDDDAERPVGVRKKRLCSIDGCDRPHKAKGYCDSHYQASRMQRESTPTVEPLTPSSDSKFCIVPSCREDGDGKYGLCWYHERSAHRYVEVV